MDISSQEIEAIVRKVIAGINPATNVTPDIPAIKSPKYTGDNGVFERVEEAVEAAWKAQRDWVTNYKVEDRHRIVEAIRRCGRDHVEEWSHLIVEETQMGRYEDKVEKHLAVINKTPGPECLTTEAISGDAGLMIEEYAPFGVIGSITPTTNPTETMIHNTISMISGGNSIVFNVHPRAKRVCAECLQALHKAIVDAGGPANLITMLREPTMDTVDMLTSNPKVRLMTGTGGMGMVNALLRSGKKCIGAGAGNPPVIVDETADVELAARKIYEGASFDNNILCFAEKEVFVVSPNYEGFIHNIQKQGAYLLNNSQVEALVKICLEPNKNQSGYEVNKKWVGKNAALILAQIGVQVEDSCRLAVCEVPADHPFVLVEQMMPVLPIVRCSTFEEAMEKAVIAEQGNRHTSSIFSKDVDHMTRFARLIETTIYVKNSCTKAGVGIGGEGHCTMTIAGPTGEGITNAKSFCRRRRCMLAEGGLRII
ncbi:propionaldehyde dehydrogenase [Anaeromicropila populeti]|uniref:Propionaldehyde dehydrogenase n=2 Tax=Anaeromicropila populeti TaxID=37658 RepID=A0A1I6K8Y9_9FIRM|nr:propionaldehyde dehydrogenase [Anaeromicropila populeti]